MAKRNIASNSSIPRDDHHPNPQRAKPTEGRDKERKREEERGAMFCGWPLYKEILTDLAKLAVMFPYMAVLLCIIATYGHIITKL